MSPHSLLLQWHLPALGFALLLGGVVGALIAVHLGRWGRRRAMLARFARGRLAEREAVGLVEQQGYRVLAEQLETSYPLEVAGESAPVKLRIDLLVARRGRCYVVEVKTGAAASPRTADTRRQLLEYLHALGSAVDGALLADMEQRRLLPVSFGHREAARGAPWRWIGLGVAVGAGACLLLARCWLELGQIG